MSNEDTRDRRLIGYLLGRLPEAEQTQLEDRYFADDALFEYLAAIETELIDAYVRGALPASDRARFEGRFMNSARLQTRIALARQLQTRVLPAPGTPEPGATRPRTRPASTPRPASALIGAVAIAVVALAATGWWAFQSTSAPPAAAATIDSAPPASRPIPVSLPVAQNVLTAERHASATGPVALVLAPGAAGSRAGNGVLTMPQGADLVRIEIDHDGAARERYAVVVNTPDRQRVWTELNLAAKAPGAKGVILELPATSLPSGDYVLTLSGGAKDARRLEALADYSFRVR